MDKILVIRLSSLGDIVLTLPVLQALRRAHPDAHISYLVKEQYADLLSNNPHIDRCIIFKRGQSVSSLIAQVRNEHFDSVLDLHANLRSRLVSFFSGAARKVRYEKAVIARRLYVGWRIRSRDLDRHTQDRYFAALNELTGKPTSAPVAGLHGTQNVLVIQTAFLGDAVLTTPLLSALKKNLPGARVTVLCTPETHEIFKGHADVEDVIVFDKRTNEKSLKAKWRLVKTLAALRFDLAILPHRSLTSALLARLAGIPRRIGFLSSQGRWLMTDTVPFQWGIHDVDRNLALLSRLGIENESGILNLRPDDQAVAEVEQWLRSSGVQLSQRMVGINAGSVWATKRWLPERFAEVSDRISEELNAQVLFVGSTNDFVLVEEIRASMRTKALNWAGKTNLKQLIAAVAQCSVFLTNDSGPMHIAVATHVPTVALFGPTTKELGFFPYGSGHIVIEKDLECRPCGLHGAEKCPLGHFECMKQISVDEVLDAVRRQMGRQSEISNVVLS